MFYLLTVLLFAGGLCSAQPMDCPITIEPLQTSYRFQKFMSFIGVKLQNFQKSHLPRVESVFYPFGGPDLLHPLLLFPDAKTYVLVGLEPPGKELSQKTQGTVFKELDSLLRRGFFVTSSMSKTLNQQSGVRAALALQILLMGGKILEDRMVDTNTVRISFEWQGQAKVAYYLKRNLVENSEGLFAFLKTQGVSDVCLFKSSSYSPHKEMFSALKKNILSTFSMVVQDDTGIPLKDLAGYEVQLFGHYTKPYGVEFHGFEQNDLKKCFEDRKDIPPLDFCFGYGCGRVQANLVVAKRKTTGKRKQTSIIRSNTSCS